jgi:transglutaminase-like putative cysteine protease
MEHPSDTAVAGAAYLQPTRFIDSDHPSIIAFAREAVGGARDRRDAAVRLYYAVRDRIRYDPYDVRLAPEEFAASRCLERGRGFCITKAGLLAACARASGIPARLGYADVKNHLSTPKLLELLGTDLFTYHGYTDLQLDGRWVKATPAFNLSLCEKFHVKPLEFDGRSDSIFHPYDADGRRHMEYVRDRGTRGDLPFDEIAANFRLTYPRMHGPGGTHYAGDFEAEASAS